MTEPSKSNLIFSRLQQNYARQLESHKSYRDFIDLISGLHCKKKRKEKAITINHHFINHH